MADTKERSWDQTSGANKSSESQSADGMAQKMAALKAPLSVEYLVCSMVEWMVATTAPDSVARSVQTMDDLLADLKAMMKVEPKAER
jgi:hypothetical protein